MIYKEISKFKQHKKNNHRLIAVDYGKSKTGIAVSDRSLSIATPLKVVISNSFDFLIEELNKIITESDPWGIVIGYPLQSDGTEGKACHYIDEIAKKISDHTDLPILLYDERFTTAIANNILIEVELSRKKRAQIDDKIAASVLLDGVLKKM